MNPAFSPLAFLALIFGGLSLFWIVAGLCRLLALWRMPR